MAVFEGPRDSAIDARREVREYLRKSGKGTIREINRRGTGGASDWATSLTIASQLPGRVDGPADAYRHLLIAAELHRVYGSVFADLLLAGHELDFGYSSNEGMDKHNNKIGEHIGRYVRSVNGSTSDVIKLAHAVMLSSFPGKTGADVSWVAGPEQTWQVKGATAITLPNGVTAGPAVVAENDPGNWLATNPVDDDTKRRLPSDRVNWPSSGWEQRFNYAGAEQAQEYEARKVPINPLPVYSRETDMDDPPRPELRGDPKQSEVAEGSESDGVEKGRGDRLDAGSNGGLVSDDLKPGKGDLFQPEPDQQPDPVQPGADHGFLQDVAPNGYTGFASMEELDIERMAEEVFSGLTLDDWAIIPDENDPFDGRDPFADGVKWVPGLGPPPEVP